LETIDVEKKDKSIEAEKEFIRQSVKMNFAELSNMIIQDLNARAQTTNKTFRKEDVQTYLTNPRRYTKELTNLSNNLYNISPHYRRVVNYFARISTLDYIVEPYAINVENINEKPFMNGFYKTVDYLDVMNLKHEMKKIQQVCWIRDTFYGYEHIGKNSYFIQQLPNEWCAISSIEDGVYNFSFNLAYFDRNLPQLEMFPKEFKSLYNKYINGSIGQWAELDPKQTICIKINEELDYDLPPLVGIFQSIFDLEDYKNLKKTRETLQNYKFIVQKIPLRENSERNNDFMLDLSMVTNFHNKSASTIPDTVGLLTVPFDVDTIDFSSDKSERNTVWEAEHEFYSSVGTSSLLFNGDNASQANLSKSIMVDEQEAFALVRQIERWVNRKIKHVITGAYKFRVKFLDMSIFNKQEYIDRLLKNAQFGIPVKMMLCSALGLTPSQPTAMAFLENNMLGLVDKFVPLQSAHTQSGKEASEETTTANPSGDGGEDGGRPLSNEDELSESGEEQRNTDANANQE
jgi:hypothetical protein